MSNYINEQSDFAFDISQLIKFAIMSGFQVTFSQAERPDELQWIYFYGKKVVEKDGTIILIDFKQRSKTKTNAHRTRKAIDLNFIKDDVYINALPMAEAKRILQPIADYFKSLHPKNIWGGEFKNLWDPDHFQRK